MFTFQRLHHWPQQHPFPYLYNSPDDGNENNYFVHYKLYMESDREKNNTTSARKVTEYVSSLVIRVPLRGLSLPITLSCDGLWLVNWSLVLWGGRLKYSATFCWGCGGRGFSSVLATTADHVRQQTAYHRSSYWALIHATGRYAPPRGKWVGRGGNLAPVATSLELSKLALLILHNRWHECIQPFIP